MINFLQFYSKTKILQEWIKSHEKYSYPKGKDLETLKEQTGLSEKQIRNWFTNYRNVHF